MLTNPTLPFIWLPLPNTISSLLHACKLSWGKIGFIPEAILATEQDMVDGSCGEAWQKNTRNSLK